MKQKQLAGEILLGRTEGLFESRVDAIDRDSNGD